ncbi:transposase [Streptomyces sp. NPDC058385]|uniref:transposase n=1 Tax=Streptomyces sp. NPDC058385 TaxID=3346473 RepID=UPI003657678D
MLISDTCRQASRRSNRPGTGSAPWSRSYFAASRGGAPLPIVRQYIENQERPVD